MTAIVVVLGSVTDAMLKASRVTTLPPPLLPPPTGVVGRETLVVVPEVVPEDDVVSVEPAGCWGAPPAP